MESKCAWPISSAGTGGVLDGLCRHMIAFRHADPRFPFLWESAAQPAARWHDDGDGPVQYFADTPNGAWADFLRHEAIVDPDDLATIQRAIWAVEIPDETSSRPRLD